MTESETDEAFVDAFNGDTSHLLRCTAALLDLDAKGALVPHGIGNDARALLGALASRLAATQWRPIDEANGSEVLVYAPCRTGAICATASNSTGQQWWGRRIGALRPTHFIPLSALGEPG